MGIKACIFDLDGVLVDTAKYHYLAWKRMAAELNFDFTEHDNELLKGVSRMDSLEILLNIGGISLTESDKLMYAEKKNNWYKEYIDNMSPDEILPGVRELLGELKNQKILLAVGSASKNAVPILKTINIYHLFDAIIDGNQTDKAKPDPQVFILASERLGVKPSECMVFEDAQAGIEAAKKGGMSCIGIGNSKILKGADAFKDGLKDIDWNYIKTF